MDFNYEMDKMSFGQNASWMTVSSKREQRLLVIDLKEELFVRWKKGLQIKPRLWEKVEKFSDNCSFFFVDSFEQLFEILFGFLHILYKGISFGRKSSLCFQISIIA